MTQADKGGEAQYADRERRALDVAQLAQKIP
jgi:hypothetical protein